MNLHVYRCPACPITAATVALRDTTAIPWCHGHATPVAMQPMSDGPVFLPLDAAPKFGPLTVDTLKAAGILLPATQHALEWLYRHRATNGMADAFTKIGGRRCIDLVAFVKLARERRA